VILVNEPQYEVLSPSGRQPAAPEAQLANRLPGLGGRTVALVWDHVFLGDRMFARFAATAADDHPDLRFVDHPAFGNIHGNAQEEHEAIDLLPSRLREFGIDAAVVGVGA
jgi:hypothetical protein